MPCYDFVPVANPTLDRNSMINDYRALNTEFRSSSVVDSLDVTGGEYKTRERIQRDMADSRLLAIPASWSRVADSNPN